MFFIAVNMEGIYVIVGSERRHKDIVNGLVYVMVRTTTLAAFAIRTPTPGTCVRCLLFVLNSPRVVPILKHTRLFCVFS